METSTATSQQEAVINFINALNNEDFSTARKQVHNDMKFVGVMGTRDGAEAYFKDMEKMKLKYNIQKIFTDNNDVCVFYDINMSGKNIFACGWYKLENEKIKSFKVLFDPRPLLEEKK